MTPTHAYGDRLHLLGEPALLSLLARIGHPDTGTAALPELVRSAYGRLVLSALDRHFPVIDDDLPTRMTAGDPTARYRGPRLCQSTRLVVCAVIRAGLLPAQVCYETACQLLPPENVRIDFLNLSRVTNDAGQVTGVRHDGSKIGGDVDDCVLLIPDPMGATGSTVVQAVSLYASVPGTPRRTCAMHLMVTPEATQHVLAACPQVHLLAARFDRGRSPADVLATPPGTHPDREHGLDDNQYIVPGAGGMGELLTNSWV